METNELKVNKEDKLAARLKLIERDCPNCDSIVMKNDAEDCFECIKCGYIDCGTEEHAAVK